jgi:16S rRNA (cytosine1402-N4)-methyltransferase
LLADYHLEELSHNSLIQHIRYNISMSNYHIPVMLNEVLENLAIKKNAWYLDCNLGGGGHTEGILKAGGKVVGLDLDPDAIHEVAKNHGLTVETINNHLIAKSENLILYQTNFANLKTVLEELQINKIDGILFDLGVSSYQLETSERGFSFNTEAPLDMRMNKTTGATAADLVNGLYEKELAELFWRYGEERFSRQIAKRIVEKRQEQPIKTTNELAQIILSARHKAKGDRTHPATRVFQALRIAVNDELRSLEEALPQTIEVLKPGGRLAVISFHSLEDRIVKNFMANEQQNSSIKIITPKPIEPTEKEVDFNPRSRSGKLRVAERI